MRRLGPRQPPMTLETVTGILRGCLGLVGLAFVGWVWQLLRVLAQWVPGHGFYDDGGLGGFALSVAGLLGSIGLYSWWYDTH